MRGNDAQLELWDEFLGAFLDHLFYQELRNANTEEFVHLKQCNMIVKEYFLKFKQLSCHSPELVSSKISKMRKFSSGLSRD